MDQVIKQLLFFDESLIADADGFGHAHTLLGEFDHVVYQDASTLADKSNTAVFRLDHALQGQEESIDFKGDIDSQAVGANERKMCLRGCLHDAVLQISASPFGEPAGDNSGRLDPCFDAIGHDIRHKIRAGGDNGEVDLPGDIRNARVNGMAVQMTAFWIHGIYLHGIAGAVLRENNVGGVTIIVCRDADHRHRFRFKHRFQIHKSSFRFLLVLMESFRDSIYQ